MKKLQMVMLHILMEAQHMIIGSKYSVILVGELWETQHENAADTACGRALEHGALVSDGFVFLS